MNGIFLLLGSNIGDKLKHLKIACKLLGEEGIAILRYSSIYETAPWGKENQDWFLNSAIQINTHLDPIELLAACLSIEQKMGRKRIEKWGSRIIDIDILYYHNMIIDTKDLKIPHPGIPERKFTLILLNELIPKEIHPVLQLDQQHLFKVCPDTSDCIKTHLAFELD